MRAGAAEGTVGGMGDRAAVAHHEAGHAIVAHVLGLRVGSVILVDDGDDSYGETQIQPDETEKRIVELYAGLEAHLCHCRDEAEAEGGAEDDLEKIKSLAVALDPLEPDKLKLKLRGEAKAHVEERWEAISTLATELLQHEKLSVVSTKLDTLLFRLTGIPWG